MTEATPTDRLNAFVPGPPVTLPGAGQGPLAGLTFAAKDLFDIAGHVTGCGNPDWAATHEPAQATAPAVTALLAAGAGLAGKTITDELAFSLAGENAHYGTPVNPAAPDRIPGGSSSGSASATAGGLVDFALGTDTGGSVRAPSSYCGLWGMRPSHGAISLDGVMPLAPSFDTVGWFARDADRLAQVGEVLLPDGGREDGALLADWSSMAPVPEAYREAITDAISRVADILGGAEPASIAGKETDGLAAWLPHFQALQWSEIWATHGAWIEAVKPTFGPGVRERFDGASRVQPEQVEAANAFRAMVSVRVADRLGPGGVMIVPTAPGPALRKGADQAEVTAFRNRSLKMLCVAGLCRLPQISMPLVTLDGAPVGISLIGAPGADRRLLTLARTVGAEW